MSLMLIQDPMISSEAIKTFSFPWNAYAWCLFKEPGSVRDLHYGLFTHPEEPVETAQRRSTDYLFDRLPLPCQLLEVGVGLGATLERLLKAGFQARGITPDPHQAEIARRVCGDATAVEVITYERLRKSRVRGISFSFRKAHSTSTHWTCLPRPPFCSNPAARFCWLMSFLWTAVNKAKKISIFSRTSWRLATGSASKSPARQT